MDLGYHLDQTVTIFDDVGFTESAVQVAWFGNALTDLVGNFMSVLGVSPENDLGASRLLHADNLFRPKDTNGFWLLFRQNVKTECAAIEEKFGAASDAEEEDKGRAATEELLILIGIAFHATQDFCSHSTWVASLLDNPEDRLAGGIVRQYQRETPLSHPTWLKEKNIVTGWYEYLEKWPGWFEPEESLTPTDDDGIEIQFHDDVSEEALDEIDDPLKELLRAASKDKHAIHLDAQHREYNFPHPDGRKCYWDEAYVCAYFACRELLTEIKSAAPDTFDSCKKLAYAGEDLQSLRSLTYQINYLFMWLEFGHHNGHWKGPGSGDILALLGHAGLRVLMSPVVLMVKIVDAVVEIYDLLQKADTRRNLMSTYIDLSSNNRLSKKLYLKNEMSELNVTNTPAPISLSLPKKVLSLRVHNFTMDAPFSPPYGGPHRSTFSLDSPNHPPSKDLDVYLKVKIEDLGSADAVDSEREREYRERIFQNVEGRLERLENDKIIKYILPPGDGPEDHEHLKGDPWEVLHIFGSEGGTEITASRITLELIDEDTLLTGADDGIKISDDKDTEAYGVTFTLDHETGKLINQVGTTELNGRPIVDDAGAPKKFPITGSSGKWFFPPDTAALIFSLSLTDITTEEITP